MGCAAFFGPKKTLPLPRNLETAIQAYLEQHNAEPKPFIWTAPAADILEKVAWGRRVLESEANAHLGKAIEMAEKAGETGAADAGRLGEMREQVGQVLADGEAVAFCSSSAP